MTGATVLYTPEVLALATSLSRFPLGDELPLRGLARSPSCGSTLEIGLALEGGEVSRVGIRSQACAIGQAAAAIFAQGVAGKTMADLAEAEGEVASWLTGDAVPSWPGIAGIAMAVRYPGRHGAVLLPWRAALSALPSDVAAR
jgi:NifU-like protein involved in Fe-S cluster formation